MGRVFLHSGGATAASRVRLSTRGASERRTAPGQDINDARPNTSGCQWCGKTKNVLVGSSPRRCGACHTDEQTIRDAKQRLKAAKQPPLGTPVPPGTPYAKIRAAAEAAQQRLNKRKQARPPAAKTQRPPAARTATAATVTTTRRPTDKQRATALRALQSRITRLERELTKPSTPAKQQAKLREDLHVARKLRTRLQDDIAADQDARATATVQPQPARRASRPRS